jgi:hypothetical protein
LRRKLILRRPLLGHIAHKAQHDRAGGPSAIGLSMMSTGNSVPSLRRPNRFRPRPSAARADGRCSFRGDWDGVEEALRDEILNRLADQLACV